MTTVVTMTIRPFVAVDTTISNAPCNHQKVVLLLLLLLLLPPLMLAVAWVQRGQHLLLPLLVLLSAVAVVVLVS